MRPPILLLAVWLAGTAAHAADTVTPPVPPQPPQWKYAIPVGVVVGADVATGVDAQLFPANLILQIKDTAKLSTPAGASDCVFEAEAWSNLAAERVTVKLRLLRCFDASGKELAHRQVRGFAVDKDGRAGIKSPLIWSQTAKDLLLLGAGAQAKQNFLARTFKSALGKASFGLTDNMGSDDDKPTISGDAIREVRSTETLLPVLTLEAGHEFMVVLNGDAR